MGYTRTDKKKKDKRANNNLKTTTQKIADGEKRIPHKTREYLMCSI